MPVVGDWFATPEVCRGHRPFAQSDTLALTNAAFAFPKGVRTPVLRRIDVSEIVAAYADGTRLLEISGNRFSLSPVAATDAGPPCLATPEVIDGVVLKEVHDDQVRSKAGGHAVRGRATRWWSTLGATNYRYLMEYAAREDGSMQFRLGATGHNAFPRKADRSDAHLHVGCWRLEFDLGAPEALRYEAIELGEGPEGGLRFVSSTLVKEGGGRWSADGFTRLRITNPHAGASPLVGYDLVPQRYGVVRLPGWNDRAFTQDYWVTRGVPTTPGRWPDERLHREVATYAAYGEPLEGSPAVVWVQAALAHVPRGEDFGPVGDRNEEGVALVMWTGFTLAPIWRSA